MSLINIERTIELDVYDHDTTPSVIKAIQLDEGTRAVYAVIQNSRQGYDIGQNAEVKLTVLRPDKTRVQITGQTFGYNGADGTMYGAKAELSDVALAVKGNLKAQFKFISGEQELRTEIFTINTGEALDAGDGDWAGDLDGHNLDEMAESIETLQTDMATVNEDVSELKSGLNDVESDVLKAYVTDSANGDIAHFVDGADSVPMKSVKVNIAPVQSGSGDPSPDNVRPISGWGSVKVMRSGKNLWNPSDVFTGFINNITNTIQANSVSKICYIRAKPNTTYTVSKMVGERFSVACSDVEPAINAPLYGVILDYTGTSITITTENSTKYLLAWCYLGSADTATEAEMLASVQFELGSDATEYEPYNGVNVSIDLGRTVYGGTLDVVSGELTVDRKYELFDGSSDEAWQFLTGSFGNRCGIVRNDVLNTGKCVRIDANGGVYSASANTAGTVFASGVSIYYYPPNTVTSLEEWKTWLASHNLQVVYPLATPITYNLTPTEVKSLLGINNIWSDAGDVEVEYRADTKLYIDKRLAEVTA